MSEVEFNEDFRFFLTTREANPHYSPEVMGKTMLVNYSVTVSGLAEQLLGVVVSHESPELNRQFVDLVNEMVTQGLRENCECYNAALITIDPATGQVLVYIPNREPSNNVDPRVAGDIDQLIEINHLRL